MTNPILALEGASYVLPDGTTLFSDLSAQFDQRHTGLVGRNGAGKTVLARILAGQLQPSAGRCVRMGSVHYLAQQVTPAVDSTVAGIACLQGTLDALERIEAGGTDPVDFDTVNDQWDIRQRFKQELDRYGLAHLEASTPAHMLSGGESMCVGLTGALLRDVDYLILDEPSNHLDRPHRHALIEQLRRWPNGLLVISHDRQLLDSTDRILELSSLGLRSYGGNYTFYAHCKTQERQSAEQQLERRRQEQGMRDQQERQERRMARGNRHGKEANQARILLDRQKERSEHATGKLRQQHAAAREQLNQRVRDAAQQVEDDAPITVHSVPVEQVAQRRVVELDQVVLPFVSGATRSISLVLTGQQRVGVLGRNGCGKSTLLKLVAGMLQPVRGSCKVSPACMYLDQQLAHLDPQCSVLEQAQAANTNANETDMRMRLAQLGLDAKKVMTPSGLLSGGERLKAALACVLYASPPPQLLLLDEPSNHLDLSSSQALETMLRSYRGALVVVSHDDAFLNALGLRERLAAGDWGWRMELW
ncbi:ABC-F family ATP-binding cassette domain-containing protein [Rhodoferax sp. GW822-FHT02A01]|uniref:ABC-F family ATP-binding cassette domain-containing protein n=1 Tax=Rhodoferax sp. GW822-FHT02A01 TaxID=3141537 RepID=UPI00315D4AB0